MKAQGHPAYYENAQVICACGNIMTIGSTKQTIHVELCSNCHPFYTGEQKFVDSASRIQKFQKKQDVAKQYINKIRAKHEESKVKDSSPKSLAEMLASIK